MPRIISSTELTLEDRGDRTLTQWLYTGLCRAILDGRLRPGTRLPATRDFARQYGVSRGIVVNVFEQLQADGYVHCQVGAGTWVNRHLRQVTSPRARVAPSRPKILPEPMAGLTFIGPARPFNMNEPALSHFPSKIWTRLAARRLRRFSSWLQVRDDGRGYPPLREAICDYLASSRGVKCTADRIAIVSGVQQGLDLIARLLLRPGDPVWMEDPGYFGATLAFRNAGARLIPIPLDEQGISIAAGRKQCARAKGAYVTPGHQFPLGTTMSLERRLALLAWANETGAFVIEDDYDSEFRFEGHPQPALQSLDSGSNVIFVGTFNKLLFPSLRMGYVVVPAALTDAFLALKYSTDLRATSIDQAILCDFIVEGHLGRHLRRMRELYGARLSALLDAERRYLKGLVEIPKIRAGLYTAGFLRNGMASREAEAVLREAGVQTIGMHRFTLDGQDPCGMVLGFAAFDENEIRRGAMAMGAALARKNASDGGQTT